MDGLRKKWSSSRGASILMALLFLLVCMMVGASVLMAAASNAGKVKSNRDEQQRSLSSALTLLCDELEKVEYVGKYRYGYVQVQRQEITGYDEKDNPIWGWVYDHTKHYYWQETGELRKKSGSSWELNKTLPLYNDLDICFAGQFEVPIGQRSPIDKYFYDTRNTSTIQPTSPHTVTLKATPTADADANTYGGLTDEVTVVAALNAKGEITLTATLTADDSYIMEAVLKPSGKPEDVIVLSASPAKQKNFGTERETPPTVERDEAEENETLNKLTWTLDRIVKKEKGAGG